MVAHLRRASRWTMEERCSACLLDCVLCHGRRRWLLVLSGKGLFTSGAGGGTDDAGPFKWSGRGRCDGAARRKLQSGKDAAAAAAMAMTAAAVSSTREMQSVETDGERDEVTTDYFAGCGGVRRGSQQAGGPRISLELEVAIKWASQVSSGIACRSPSSGAPPQVSCRMQTAADAPLSSWTRSAVPVPNATPPPPPRRHGTQVLGAARGSSRLHRRRRRRRCEGQTRLSAQVPRGGDEVWPGPGPRALLASCSSSSKQHNRNRAERAVSTHSHAHSKQADRRRWCTTPFIPLRRPRRHAGRLLAAHRRNNQHTDYSRPRHASWCFA